MLVFDQKVGNVVFVIVVAHRDSGVALTSGEFCAPNFLKGQSVEGDHDWVEGSDNYVVNSVTVDVD